MLLGDPNFPVVLCIDIFVASFDTLLKISLFILVGLK